MSRVVQLFAFILLALIGNLCGEKSTSTTRNSPDPTNTSTFPDTVRDDTRNIPDALLSQLIADINKKNGSQLSESEIENLKNNLHSNLNYPANLKDLVDGEVPLVFVWTDKGDWRGDGANSDYWIYKTTKKGFVLLLNDKELFRSDNTSLGYPEFVSERFTGQTTNKNGELCSNLILTPYEYDGRKYRAQKTRHECRVYGEE